MIGVCKFCQCTENSPCIIDGGAATDGYGNFVRTACAWLLEDVCTNPDCVLKAYLEARPHAESLMQALDMILEAA